MEQTARVRVFTTTERRMARLVAAAAPFVEATVIDDPPLARAPVAPPALVVRLARGRQLEVPASFDAEHLRRLIRAVESC